MKKPSMVKIELIDQYIKCIDGISIYKEKIEKECVKGYISTKKIKGHEYHYLQWKDNGKLRSKYIEPEHYNVLVRNIELRKEYKVHIKEMQETVKEIEKFIGKKDLKEYLKLW